VGVRTRAPLGDQHPTNQTVTKLGTVPGDTDDKSVNVGAQHDQHPTNQTVAKLRTVRGA